MNKDEYLAKMKELEVAFKQQGVETMKEFALSNNPYSISEVISSSYTKLIIDKISVELPYSSDLPECRFYGPQLKKDGTLRKDEARASIAQHDIIIVNGGRIINT